MQKALEAIGLSKVFKRKLHGNGIKQFFFPDYSIFTAVDNVSFEVKKGEVFGLLGPNGAGKTTIIKMICGFLQPTKGTVKVNGKKVNSYHDLSDSLAFMFGPKVIYYRMTGHANLKFFAKMQGIKNQEERIEELAERFGLGSWMQEYVEHYSMGMKYKLALARALIGDPEILLLDEPTQGIDALGAVDIRKNIKEMGKTIFLTTHNLEEAEVLCDRIAIMDRGKILKIGSPEALKRDCGKKNATLLDAFVKLVGGKRC